MNSRSGGWWSSHGARIVFWQNVRNALVLDGRWNGACPTMVRCIMWMCVDRMRMLVSAHFEVFCFFLLGFALPLTDATAKLRPSRRITQSARGVERERLRRVDVAVAVQRT